MVPFDIIFGDQESNRVQQNIKTSVDRIDNLLGEINNKITTNEKDIMNIKKDIMDIKTHIGI